MHFISFADSVHSLNGDNRLLRLQHIDGTTTTTTTTTTTAAAVATVAAAHDDNNPLKALLCRAGQGVDNLS